MGTMVLKHVQQPKNLGCQLQIRVGGNLTLDEWGFSPIFYLTHQVHYLKPTYSLEIYLFMTIKSNIVRMTKKDGNSMGLCNFSDLWSLRLIYFLEQVDCALFGNWLQWGTSGHAFTYFKWKGLSRVGFNTYIKSIYT